MLFIAFLKNQTRIIAVADKKKHAGIYEDAHAFSSEGRKLNLPFKATAAFDIALKECCQCAILLMGQILGNAFFYSLAYTI